MTGDTSGTVEYRTLTFADAQMLGCPPPNGVYWTDDDIDEWEQGIWLFVDGVGIECIGTDGGEPEDQTLSRDWAWVAKALNQAVRLGSQSARPDA